MRFLCARQAWHDAFMTDLAAPDFATQAANVGVQKTARGADNAIVDHCERGGDAGYEYERSIALWLLFGTAQDSIQEALCSEHSL